MVERKPHAPMDLHSRRWKGIKIERLLQLEPGPVGRRMLEIGTGSGGIADYFATRAELGLRVDAVDVVDNRGISGSYGFTKVDGVALPFADECFDIVLSNHVIEHVGERAAQLGHLAEMRRVMKPDGIGYLAVPNRWMLIEPHYRLPLLSWLPRSWRTPYLRAMRRGDFYDCEPLQLPELEHMFRLSGLRYQNLCIEALHLTLQIERPDSLLSACIKHTPRPMLNALRRLIPTLIYRVWISS